MPQRHVAPQNSFQTIYDILDSHSDVPVTLGKGPPIIPTKIKQILDNPTMSLTHKIREVASQFFTREELTRFSLAADPSKPVSTRFKMPLAHPFPANRLAILQGIYDRND